MIEAFFDNLSVRLSNENHLSDITWAIAEASPVFRNLFLHFFFEEVGPGTEIDLFRREHSDGDCRPDFFFRAGRKEYIIEVKLWDTNHHFDQYKAKYPTAKLG